MRDLQRIPEVLSLVQSVWEKSPGLKTWTTYIFLASMVNQDPFYIEEDDLLLAVQKFHERL